MHRVDVVGEHHVLRTARDESDSPYITSASAGEQLYAAARPALEDLWAAVATVSELGGELRGTLRVHIAVRRKAS
jgi:hypothetical protein